MYRVLGENTLVAERRRLARHPAKVCPELVATAPQQVYSWDITKLAGPVKGTYFDAYVMIDVYSRYIVGAHVHTHESGVLAKELMEQIFDAVIAAETNDTARGAADLVNGAPDAPSAEAAAPGRTQRDGKRGVSWTRILAYGVLPGLALLLAGAAG
jgi:transposase InsO family protein